MIYVEIVSYDMVHETNTHPLRCILQIWTIVYLRQCSPWVQLHTGCSQQRSMSEKSLGGKVMYMLHAMTWRLYDILSRLNCVINQSHSQFHSSVAWTKTKESKWTGRCYHQTVALRFEIVSWTSSSFYSRLCLLQRWYVNHIDLSSSKWILSGTKRVRVCDCGVVWSLWRVSCQF